MRSLTVIVPALNEESNIEKTITNAAKVFTGRNLDWEISIVNDGSSDRTGEIADRLAEQNKRIKVFHHQSPKGIGCCFKDGIESAEKEYITWLPADGENDPVELIKYFHLVEHVDIIVPFVINAGVRSWGRQVLSTIYSWIINMTFGTMFNYTNGNIIYSNRVFQTFRPVSCGFFYQTECLIKAVRSGFTFAEVPVRLNRRISGKSKALSIKSFYSIFKDFVRVFIYVYIIKRGTRKKGE